MTLSERGLLLSFTAGCKSTIILAVFQKNRQIVLPYSILFQILDIKWGDPPSASRPISVRRLPELEVCHVLLDLLHLQHDHEEAGSSTNRAQTLSRHVSRRSLFTWWQSHIHFSVNPCPLTLFFLRKDLYIRRCTWPVGRWINTTWTHLWNFYIRTSPLSENTFRLPTNMLRSIPFGFTHHIIIHGISILSSTDKSIYWMRVQLTPPSEQYIPDSYNHAYPIEYDIFPLTSTPQ